MESCFIMSACAYDLNFSTPFVELGGGWKLGFILKKIIKNKVR